MNRTRIAALSVVALATVALALAAPQAIQIGQKADNFSLKDPAGIEHGLFERPPATVVLFVATQCPVSNAYNERMAKLALKWAPQGVRFLAVNANSTESAAEVAAHAKEHGFPFPVVKDPGNKIADAWGALVTPESYVLDRDGTLRYHGRIDDSQDPSGVSHKDLDAAISAVIAGKAPAEARTRAFGCTIKRVGV
jgi:peroxiredoxin